MLGLGALCAFMGLGVLAVWQVKRLPPMVKLWLGASMGLAAMMTLPALFAFPFTFDLRAQVAALIAAAALAVAAWLAAGRNRADGALEPATQPPWRMMLMLVVPLTALGAYLCYTHTLQPVGGALYVGQSTYGDLCLHLGIATGLRGQAFPPDYTILPGTPLGYPFLFDALSATMMVLGTDLTTAFLAPSIVAIALVGTGFVLLSWEMTRDRRAVVIAFLLLFLNGGLGFLYLFDGWPQDMSRLYDALFGFYRAPANMPDLNLRWVNILCDLLIPQRTLLGGWTMLIPALYGLMRAVKTGKRGWFAALGVWAGLMPMVHTHSFLALALISAGAMIACTWRAPGHRRAVLVNFALYGLIAAALAAPQVLAAAVPQTLRGQSLRIWLNWVNQAMDGSFIDGYFWFWIKNVGPVYLLLIPAALNAPKPTRPLALGALIVYIVAELVVFQPNEYDNNKLFVAAYLVMLPMVARLLSRVWARMKGIRGRALLAAVFILVCTASGAISIAREAISSYELLGEDEVLAARYIEENLPADAVFLTGTQHNNAVAALTGRRIVCGAREYLYFHGVNYQAQEAAARAMLSDPAANEALMTAYAVDYACISQHERMDFGARDDAFRALYPVVYEGRGVTIYAVSQRARNATFASAHASYNQLEMPIGTNEG